MTLSKTQKVLAATASSVVIISIVGGFLYNVSGIGDIKEELKKNTEKIIKIQLAVNKIETMLKIKEDYEASIQNTITNYIGNRF